ncbi:polysaccharide deacetylase family protein [Rudaea sp.]|uniref:polysaccharide deacetylase family protein n=1 Tax=Rudaea sp. TaxID=2136325 RepID=UPI00321FF763
MRVPILTWHSNNVAGGEYAGNDLVAFARDLRLIDDLGLRIVPVQRVVDCLLGRDGADLRGCVALTCDDGTDLDFRDLVHPEHGPQRSFAHSLRAFREERGMSAQPELNLTSFVIADPAARAKMEQDCLGGNRWLDDGWWGEAEASGLISIENHSWDHNHPCLPSPGPHALVRGDFHALGDDAQARFEIAQAQDFIERRSGRRPRLFCYPFGHVSPFVRDWLERNGPELGLDAAFGDGATVVTEASDRWNLPRYICGWHWRTPEELAAILSER